MATFELIMPKLGESVIEATITRWMKSAGDTVNEDDAIVEIATERLIPKYLHLLKVKLSKPFLPKAK